MEEFKKLEIAFPMLLRNTYVIYPTGGYHPFKDVEEAAPIFRDNCWPYIKRIHWPTDRARNNPFKERTQMNVNLSIRHIYPQISLTKPNKVIKKEKGRNARYTQAQHYILMHQAVARCFVPNPENKPHVCHLNDDPADYRVCNLKWGTNRENHTGRAANRKKDFKTLHAIFKLNNWAVGE